MTEETKIAKVKDIMTKEVVTFRPDDPLPYAARMFEEYDYDGFPVVDRDGHLVGILTAYDMVLQSSRIHLPAVFYMMQKVNRTNDDHKILHDQFQKLNEIKIIEVMNADPLVTNVNATVEELAREFAEHHRVNPIPVVDDMRKLLGVVSRYDVIKFFNEQYLNDVIDGNEHGGILKRLGRIAENIEIVHDDK